MRQRIVIDVPLNEENRKKAMKLASEMRGVSRVEVVRDRNHLVVVGEDIDSVKLVKSLRKKFCFANIITVHNSNATTTTESREFEVERHVGEARVHYEYPTRHYGQPGYYMADPFYDPNAPTSCFIL